MEQRLLPVVRAVTSIKHGVILANGDTVHPVSVEKTLLAARGDGQKIILALDTVKQLADEEMKVVVDPAKGVQQHHQADGPGRGDAASTSASPSSRARPPPSWPTR